MPKGRAGGLKREWSRLRAGALRNVHEPLTGLAFATLGNLVTGLIIGAGTERLALVPALIVLIPGAISMRGNIFSAMGSRLGSQLHMGLLPPRFRWGKVMAENHRAAFFLSLIMSTYLGFLAGGLAWILGFPGTVPELVLASVLAGLVSGFFLFFLTAAIALGSYRFGWDPDNVTIPIVTLAGDLLTLPILFWSLDLVLLLPGGLLWPLALLFAVGSVACYVLVLQLAKHRALSRRVVQESVPLFILCGLLSSGSGFLLGSQAEGLLAGAGLLTILPAFLTDGGAIGGILAARFTSGLHTGQLRPGLRPDREVKDLFILTHLLGLLIFPAIGVMGTLINRGFNIPTPDLVTLVLVTLIAGQVLLLFVNGLSFYSAALTHRFGLDPDSLVIPVITSAMDLLGTVTLLGAASLFGII